MNAEQLLKVYEKLSEAPDAIARLRRFVLDLAVRGKLVEPDAGDEFASRLVSELASAKKRLVESRQIKKPRSTTSIALGDLPIECPSHWEWLGLTDIGRLSGGMTPSKTKHEYWEGSIVWLSPKDIKSDELETSELKITEQGLNDTGLELYPVGSLFIVARSGILKRTFPVAINRVPAASNQDLKVLTPYVSGLERYIQIMFRGMTDFLLRNLVKTGTTVQSLKYAEFEDQAFPLPPLAEQHRIVAKVNELMALCDRLEEARKTREETRDKLTAASLARLTAPDTTPEDFPAHAAFALEALPALTTRPDQIKTLRQTILNLAVRGKLVEQDPADEEYPPVDKNLPSNAPQPFQIPKSWQWVRMHSLGSMKGGGTPSKSRDDYWNGSIPWVSPKDMKLDYISSAQLSVTEAAVAGSSVNLLPPESVMFVVRGMILAHSFPVAISRSPVTINQDMKAIILRDPRMSEYILRALWGLKPEMLNRVQRSTHGTCRIEGKDYSDFLIPLPPLAEQHRIVAKVDVLMSLCDRLQAALTTTDTTRTRLFEALLHEPLEPTTEVLEAAQ